MGPEGSFQVFEEEKIRAARGENISVVVTHANVPREARFEVCDDVVHECRKFNSCFGLNLPL